MPTQSPSATLAGKRILLVIGGGIAAYKSLDLVRRLRERGARVRAILTRAATEFVTPLSVASLTGDKAYTELFDLTDEAEMGHIQLSRDADLLVVAPATADLVGRMVNGLANDLATTALLATDKRILLAPAMNVRMWHHPAMQRNLARARADGCFVVGPNEGDMACGEYGLGRMAEPLEIVAAVEALFLSGEPLTLPLPSSPGASGASGASGAAGAAAAGGASGASGPLAGVRVLVTSGPTHEPIDPVRYIANRSSGRQGHAIAAALAMLGAEVRLVSGPVAIPDPPGVTTVHVETAREMLRACEAALPVDVAVCAAAVADWRSDAEAGQKLKKDRDGLPTLRLTENPDILRTLAAAGPRRPRLVVGFAAETESIIDHATAKRARKGCDWIVANDVSAGTGVMGGADNTVHLVTAAGVETWPTMRKDDVARRLAERVAAALVSGETA